MICNFCPRDCGAVRTDFENLNGFCKSPFLPVIGKVMLHKWEEPCLTGENGAGAVFFSGCNLKCVFCQNYILSRENRGETVTPERLREIFWDLIAQGAACLDLVTPTHFTPVILKALGDITWPVPIVWNSSAYEKPEVLKLLENRVQIYLPDLKYALNQPAKYYSGTENYFQYASAAILEMFRQTGPYKMQDGQLKSGVLIRHLILPGEIENTRRVMDWIARNFKPGDILFSLMRQYTPQENATGKLARRVTGSEYKAALKYLENLDIRDGYTQDRASAESVYTPDF